ncbi:DUF58 domain-containing protein [Frigoribacterium sp. UYMn621]|uniref:DUF58 domain-containing protein n=1 Tax=Frigoribacterium sp. UYMn621 TaxID=3156343 RepID=UPI0033977D34
MASAVIGFVGNSVRPRLEILSSGGWIALALAAATLTGGFILGWQELTFVGLTVLVGLVFCTVFLIGRTTYNVAIELSPSRVVVGERALGRLVVTNSGTRPVLAARMELPVGAGRAEFSIPALKPEQEHDELFAVPTNRRAIIATGPAVSVRGDQLGLLRRVVRWTDPVDLFVHPVTTPLAPSAAGLVRDLEGQVTKKITNSDLSFHALRGYEPGDDRRYVHWRTSARLIQQTGDPMNLMVRQFEETRRSQLTVLQSESSAFYDSEDEFELAVSVATSLAAQVIRDGTALNVVSESRRLHTYSASAMLDDSCRMELSIKLGKDARECARVATKRLPPPSVLFIVAGSKMTASDYRQIGTLFPADTTVIAFRVELGAEATLRQVAGVKVAVVGALRDLPKVVARAAG